MNRAEQNHIWVVAADAGRARFFRAAESDGHLKELDDMLDPDSRSTAAELQSDRLGHVRNSRGSHSLEQRPSLHEAEALAFARRVGHRLVEARRRGDFQRLYLAADPKFLGLLRAELDAPTRRLVAGEIDKDVSRESADAIRQRLPGIL